MIFRFTILFFFCIPKLYSQDNYNTEYRYLMSAKLEKKNLTVFSEYRAFDLGGNPRSFLASAYLDFELRKNLKPAIGIMYLDLHSYKADGFKKQRNEVRPYQQVTLSTNYERIGISQRLRFEERFFGNPDMFVLRLRYLLSLQIPFNKVGKKEVFYGFLSNEILLNGINNAFFDSDIVTVGVAFVVSKKFTIELGYFSEIESKRNSQFAYIGFKNYLDWRKKNKAK